MLSNKMRLNAIGVAIGSLSRLLAGIVIARQLGPDLNGQFAFLIWFTESLVLVFNGGLPGTLNRFLALDLGRGDSVGALRTLQSSWLIGIILGFAASLAAYCLTQWYLNSAPNGTSDTGLLLALLVAAQLWAGLSQAFLTGMQEFGANARIVIVSSLTLLLGQSIGAIFFGLSGAIYGVLLSYGVAVILSFGAVSRMLHRGGVSGVLQPRLSRQFMHYSRDAWLTTLISAVVWGRTELFFLERFSTPQEAGFFAAGLVFSSLIVQAVNLVSGVMLPHLSHLMGSGQASQINNDYRRITIFIALFTFPVAFGGVALMPEITTLAFGPQYAGMTPAAQWLLATGVLAFATVGSSVVYSHGDAHIIRNWSIFGAVILVCLCSWFAPNYGAAGVSAARFFVQAALIASGFYLLHKHYMMPVPIRVLALLLISALCCGSVASIVSNFCAGGIPGLVLGMLSGAVAYAFCLRILQVISAEDASTLRSLFCKLPPALRATFNFVLSMACYR